jgi:hypothetical protein
MPTNRLQTIIRSLNRWGQNPDYEKAFQMMGSERLFRKYLRLNYFDARDQSSDRRL